MHINYNEAQRTRIPNAEGKLWCIWCQEMKPVEDFYRIKPYQDGSPRWKSWCRPCDTKRRREQRADQTARQVWRDLAPKNAAKKMIEMYPEKILPVIERAYPVIYARILEEERQRLLRIKEVGRQRRLHKYRLQKEGA